MHIVMTLDLDTSPALGVSSPATAPASCDHEIVDLKALRAVRLCGWCDPVELAAADRCVLWRHTDPAACWAGPSEHEHTTWVCAGHDAREQAHLNGLGHTVTGVCSLVGNEATDGAQ